MSEVGYPRGGVGFHGLFGCKPLGAEYLVVALMVVLDVLAISPSAEESSSSPVLVSFPFSCSMTFLCHPTHFFFDV